MVALKAAEIDSFVARPNPSRPIVLVFGPDTGLVRERAEAIVRASVEDVTDPFMLARIDGDEIASDPARLIDEVNTIPLVGGRRAVWVKAGSRNFAPAVEAVLAAPNADCRVVIEAGDLKRTSPLRVLCERAKAAAAIASNPDGERDLGRLIDDEFRAADLEIASEAKALLVALLGGDRLASRGEVRKLALYARGKPRVELEDVLAVVSDASALATDDVLDAAFAGRTGDVESTYGKLRTAGTTPSTVASAALRYVGHMHKARLALDHGAAMEEALRVFVPPVHRRRSGLVGSVLANWTAPRLARVMGQLAQAVLETRRQPALAESLAQRALLSIATSARRKEQQV